MRFLIVSAGAAAVFCALQGFRSWRRARNAREERIRKFMAREPGAVQYPYRSEGESGWPPEQQDPS